MATSARRPMAWSAPTTIMLGAPGEKAAGGQREQLKPAA
jgi:hypothetical protein